MDSGRVLAQGDTKIIDLRLKGFPWDKNTRLVSNELNFMS
jgi:hypothetical protein